MKTKYRLNNLEIGQIIPIVVISMFALIAMAALLIDGGMLLSNRRTAQAAADAGALAGAYELCYNTKNKPLEVASKYAVDNGADDPPIAVIDNGRVKVTATVTTGSFFARVIGYDSLPATAEAVAGCIPPSGRKVMPVAWSCRPPMSGKIGETSFTLTEFDCLLRALNWPEIKPYVEGGAGTVVVPLSGSTEYRMHTDNTSIVYTNSEGKVRPHPYVYIVMNTKSESDDFLCKEDLDPTDPLYDSAMTCYTDGGVIQVGGNRGWLTLDVNLTVASAAQLKDWIENGYPGEVETHSWLVGQPGGVNVAFSYMQTYQQGKVVWLPVFNEICEAEKDPCNNKACMDKAHATVPYHGICITKADSQVANKYHVVAFSPFYVSCVRDKPKDECPGFTYAKDLYPDDFDDNIKSVEGYFLIDVEKDMDQVANCDVDLGNCTVSLVE